MSSPAQNDPVPPVPPVAPAGVTTEQPAGVTTEQPAIEPDDDYETSSDYGDSIGSSTQSITSTIKDYVYENGRRYHRYAEGKYISPNDEMEQDRLDLFHHLCSLVLGGRLYTAPIGDEPHNILDCGTGTGIWALDMADIFRCAQVVGVDLSPIQPSWVAPNCKFEVDDLSEDWTFPKDHFDFIHSRDITYSFADLPRYIKQMYLHAKPDGWVELVECEMGGPWSDDNSVPADCGFVEYMKLFQRFAAQAKFGETNGHELKKHLEAAGFVDVSAAAYKIPWGTWPKQKELKEQGAIGKICLESGFEAYAVALFTRVGGMSPDEVKDIISRALKDVSNRQIHSYTYRWHVIGRKPKPGEVA